MKIIESGLELNKQKMNVLIKEKEFDYPCNDYYTHPDLICQMMNACFNLNKKAEEYLYLLCLTNIGELITCFEVSHGTCSSSLAGIREIMIRALLAGSSNIVVVHNHPSGNTEPSKADCEITTRLREVTKLMEIGFYDHIIIGGDSYYSFYEAREH